MTTTEEQKLMAMNLRPWQRSLAIPSLAISTSGDQINYHDLRDTEDCEIGEINAITYNPEHPEGKRTRVHRRQLFGLLNSSQFGTAAQWGWTGMAHISELVFGDPNWFITPYDEKEDIYNIGYQPRPDKVDLIYPELYREN